MGRGGRGTGSNCAAAGAGIDQLHGGGFVKVFSTPLAEIPQKGCVFAGKHLS